MVTVGVVVVLDSGLEGAAEPLAGWFVHRAQTVQ